MTGRERIEARLRGQPSDRLPLMPITMMFAAGYAGLPYRQYATDGGVLAEAQCRVARDFGFDYVSAISDPAREVADLGGVVEWFDDQPPALPPAAPLLTERGMLARLQVPDPARPGRMSDRVLAVRELAARAASTHVIEGWVEGPCAMAADLRGLNALMLDFYDEPGFVRELMEFACAMELRFAAAQIEAGATLIGVGDAAASLIGPKLYRDFVQAAERKLIDGIHALGVPVRLHICGNTRRIVAGMAATGAEIIDLDYFTPLDEARAAAGPGPLLLGNLDPVRALRDATPEQVYAAIAVCHAGAGERYIVGAGCEIPRGTPHENVHAMARYAAEHR